MMARYVNRSTPKKSSKGLRDLFADHLRQNRKEWTARGAASFLVDNVYPPDRIAALDAGTPVEVYGWEVKPVLMNAEARFVNASHRYTLADRDGGRSAHGASRLYPIPCGAYGCGTCGGA